MSYTPTNWNCGDVVTAAALNKIEQGIADAGDDMFITLVEYDAQQSMQSDEDVFVANHTAAEMQAAYEAGKILIAMRETEGAWLIYRLQAVGNIPYALNFVYTCTILQGSANYPELNVYQIAVTNLGGDDAVYVSYYANGGLQ